MADNFRRNQPDVPEQLIVHLPTKDANVPKLLVNNLVLFSDIISDLFPGQTERTFN
jgi:dynein heavy chain